MAEQAQPEGGQIQRIRNHLAKEDFILLESHWRRGNPVENGAWTLRVEKPIRHFDRGEVISTEHEAELQKRLLEELLREKPGLFGDRIQVQTEKMAGSASRRVHIVTLRPDSFNPPWAIEKELRDLAFSPPDNENPAVKRAQFTVLGHKVDQNNRGLLTAEAIVQARADDPTTGLRMGVNTRLGSVLARHAREIGNLGLVEDQVHGEQVEGQLTVVLRAVLHHPLKAKGLKAD